MPPQPSTTMTLSRRRSTTQGLLWSLCCSAVALWFLLVATTTTTVTAATTQDSHLHLRNRRGLQNVGRQVTQVASKVPPTNPYALYSLPPFTITFTSAYSAKGLPADLQERGKLLASTLHAPLQLITAEFLMESFRIEIAQHHRSSSSSSNSATTSTVSNNNNETTLTFSSSQQDEEEESVWLEAMLNSFMTLDLQVAVRSLDATGQRRQRMLLEGEPRADAAATTASSSSTFTKQADVLTFQADFFTTAAFLDPNTHARANIDDNNNNADDDEYNNNQNTIQLGGTTTSSNSNNGNPSPSNDEVATLMGAWIENAFVKDYEYYTEALVNSEEAVLQNLQSIDIETNSDAVFDPYATGTLSSSATNTHTTSTSTTTATNNNNNGAAAASPNDGGAWSPSEKTFFTVLVMVSVLSIAGLLLAIKRYSVRGRKLRRMLSLEGSGGDFGPGGIDEFSDHVLHNGNGNFHNNNTVLGGRHADEVMDILNASDRYLATHRPDLLEAMQKSQQLQEQRQLHQLQQQHGGGIIPVATNHDDHNNGRPVERRYVTVTNPFSYLYGASYFHSEKQAVEEDRRRARREEEDPMAGVELQPESVPDDEDLDLILADNRHSTDTSVSGFLQTWFQQLVGARTFAAAAASAGPARDDDDDDNDNDSGGLIDDVMDDLVIEECLDHAQHGGTTASTILACDEDPSQYKFAYKDFPRQDGTPCLIYEETLDEEEEEQYLRNSKRDSLHSTTTYGIHDPLTDDEFQRALSQHSLMDFQQRSLSFEQQENSSSSSIVQTDDGEFEGDDYDADQSNATNNDDSGAETDPAQFTDKLEKLVAMRHRHYEKQKIVDKHREQRRQERARQRAEQKQKEQEEMKERDRRLRRHSLELDIQELEAAVGSGAGTSVQGPPSTSSKAIVTPTDNPGGHQQQGSWNQQQARANLRQVQKPSLHRRTSSEADKRVSPSAASAGVVGIQTNRSMDLDEHRVLNNQGLMMEASNAASIRSLPMPNNSRLVQSARKDRIALNDIFRPVNHVSPRLISVATESATGSTPNSMPPKFMQKIEIVPVVSPASSMTDTGSTTAPSSGGDRSPSSSRATPPLMMGSGSIRDGSSARKKKRETLSASAALANGFNVRRSMSFGAMEEKKMDDEVMNNSYVDGGSDNSGKQPLPPQRRRSNSVNRHRRSNSNSPADVMVHGIYAQFV